MLEDEIAATPAVAPRSLPWAKTTFVALFAMNMLDFLDRNMLMAMQPQIKGELGISNFKWGLLTSIFLVSYSLFGPVMGWLGDRFRRTWLIGLGVGVWSLATIASGLAHSYGQLALARSVLGVGEATYGVIAPTILVDLFAREKRARLMSTYYLAMPIGSAIGIGLGSVIASKLHWNLAFFLVGAPGSRLRFWPCFFPSLFAVPARVSRPRSSRRTSGPAPARRLLGAVPERVVSVFGPGNVCLHLCDRRHAGLGAELPLQHSRLRPGCAGTFLGIITLGAAVSGMSAGGWIADRLAKSKPQALFLVPSIAMFGSIPFVLLALFSSSAPAIFAAIFAAEALMFVNTGPCNAIIANVVQPNLARRPTPSRFLRFTSWAISGRPR